MFAKSFPASMYFDHAADAELASSFDPMYREVRNKPSIKQLLQSWDRIPFSAVRWPLVGNAVIRRLKCT